MSVQWLIFIGSILETGTSCSGRRHGLSEVQPNKRQNWTLSPAYLTLNWLASRVSSCFPSLPLAARRGPGSTASFLGLAPQSGAGGLWGAGEALFLSGSWRCGQGCRMAASCRWDSSGRVYLHHHTVSEGPAQQLCVFDPFPIS